jgi:MYXO-CTERM domain-containing protein
MTQGGSAVLILVLGVLLALVSIFADALGVGGQPGFGWKQTIGLVVGLALVGFGLWRRR